MHSMLRPCPAYINVTYLNDDDQEEQIKVQQLGTQKMLMLELEGCIQMS